MASIIKTKKFVYTSCEANSNKQWIIHLFDNGDVRVEFGRIGNDNLQSKDFPGEGEDFFNTKIKDKIKPSKHYLGGSYKEVETLDSSIEVSNTKLNASTNELKKLATKQIASCPITEKLVAFFVDVNAHDIYKATSGKIQYNASSGLFQTPLGIITKASIEEARSKLDIIAGYVEKNKLSDKKFIKTLEDYCMLIPSDLGRKFSPVDFIGSQAKVQAQNTLLDGLDASYASAISIPQSANQDVEPQLFNVKMAVLDDKEEFSRIEKLFNKTRKDIHYSAKGKKLIRVYTISIEHMNKEFENYGKKMDNIWELWHGTKPSNAISLLKKGFIIPPATASYVCGRSFLDGVYFSDISTKSLQYATGHWNGRDEGKYFMLLNSVAMGKYFIPNSSMSGKWPSGYDSIYAKAGETGGLIHSEMVVPNTAQIKPNFLCEFSD